MDIWIWLLIGFLTGIVVAAIVGLLFRGSSSNEEDKTQIQAEAQLAKSEVKIKVLEDKLRLAEADKLALKEKLEADYHEQYEAAQAEYRAELAIAESEKIALAASLAEAQNQLKLANEQKDQAVAKLESEAGKNIQEEQIGSSSLEEVHTSSELLLAKEEEIVLDEQGNITSEREHIVGEAEELIETPDLQTVEEVFDSEEVGVAEIAAGTDEEDASTVEFDDLSPNEGTEPVGQVTRTVSEDEFIEDVDPSISEDDEIEQIESFEEQELVEEEALVDDQPDDRVETADAGENIEEDLSHLEEIVPDVVTTAAAAEEAENSLESIELDDLNDPVIAGMQVALDQELSTEDDEELDTLGQGSPEEEVMIDEPQAQIWPEDNSVWRGEYFNNVKLEGEPDLVREDKEIDFNWEFGSPAPEINIDNFSVRWTREANFPPGLYRFTVTSDDGARLWVNERLVISAWYDHKEMTFRREMELPGGPVNLRLEYYEKDMEALIQCSWERIG